MSRYLILRTVDGQVRGHYSDHKPKIKTMNPAIVTFADNPMHPGLKRLTESAYNNRWDPQSVFVVSGPWTGWVGRMRRILEQIPKLKEQGFDCLIAVDSYDVICLGSPAEIALAMADAGNPAMLMAAEGACWPNAERASEYPPRHLPQDNWHFCHSQYTLDLTQPLPEGLGRELDHEDDQRHLTNLYLKPTPGIVLDTKCRVIQSTAHSNPWHQFFEVVTNPFDPNKKRVLNKITGTAPVFFHQNGGTDGDWIPGYKL